MYNGLRIRPVLGQKLATTKFCSRQIEELTQGPFFNFISMERKVTLRNLRPRANIFIEGAFRYTQAVTYLFDR